MYANQIRKGKIALADRLQKKDAYLAANTIARFCQTSVRGRKAREKVQLKRWEKANLAAYRIQSAFRKWRLLEFSKIKITWGNKKTENNQPRPWHVITSGAATYEEKIDVWRNVIELRRTNREASPEVCLKALINAHGEFYKAVNLLNSKDFIFFAENKTSLSDELKAALNPSQLSNKKLDERLKAQAALNTSKAQGSSARHGRALRAHRHLQESIRNSMTLSSQDAPDDHIDLRNIVNNCYYTSQFVGTSKFSVLDELSSKKKSSKRGGRRKVDIWQYSY